MKNELLDILRSCREPKICILGIGSEFKADDAAGVVLIDELQKRYDKDNDNINTKVLFINGGTAPENFTGDIKRFAPTHLFIVDAAEMGEQPGTIKIIPEDKIGGVSFSTHLLPIAVMINYLRQSIDFESVIIAIEPQDFEFGHGITLKVKQSVDKLTDDILEVINSCLNK